MSKIDVNKRLVIECLKELADRHYQKRVWVIGDPNEVSGFNDVTAALYDDSLLGDALECQQVTFTPDIDRMLLLLEKRLAGVPEYVLPEKLLALPMWNEVINMANNIVEAINHIEND